EYFLNRFALQYDRRRKHLHPSTAAWLPRYEWPGNVRELENLILREFLLAEDDVISIAPLGRGADTEGGERPDDPREAFKVAKARAIAKFERSYLRDLLIYTGGNISHAARISHNTGAE